MEPTLFDQPSAQPPSIPSVSEFTKRIKSILEQNFSDVHVEGEVSQPKVSKNGHMYFTLKDEDAQLPCVVWRSVVNRLGLKLEQGQQIIAGGNLQVYPPHGRYQLIIDSVQQAGLGALQQAFEKLKKELEEEGLFDSTHKKELPEFPKTIGVITSSTGAAFQDIRSTLERRWPLSTLKLHHASVQGTSAASEIAAAIRWFDQNNACDVLIIGRGGGSLEDLWPFNEEVVARAVFECSIPVVSAVGHETDFSISDFVADARAATPTQAASTIVPDINEVRMFIEDQHRRIEEAAKNLIKRKKELVEYYGSTYALQQVREKVAKLARQQSDYEYRLKVALSEKLHNSKTRLQELKSRLELQNPKAPLEKGFTRILQEDQWIRCAAKFDPESSFTIEWHDKQVVQLKNTK